MNIKHGIKISVLICMTICLETCFKNPDKVILTTEITDYSISGIKVSSRVLSDGGSDIFQKGVCWSNYKDPAITDMYTVAGTGSSDYESVLPGVDMSARYYIRSYALNGAGISYGPEDSVSLAVVYIESFSDITDSSAFFTAVVQSDGEIQSRGICWSTSMNPTINGNKTIEGSGSGTFTSTVSGLDKGVVYYARPYVFNQYGVFYGDEVTFKTNNWPTVSTTEISNTGTFIPTTGGAILENGGKPVIKTGICWSTHPLPTTDDNISEDRALQSSLDLYPYFISHPYGLIPSTTYYLRAYATNLVGTGYGEQKIFVTPQAAVFDLDGNPYSSVNIGSQVWLVENLKTTRYANGDIIPKIPDLTDWYNTVSGAWSYYDNDAQYEIPYGKLYNWFAVSDSRNLCPSGWHFPKDEEWSLMIDYLGGNNVAGGKLKESGTTHWVSPNNGASNLTGFTALPGGSRPGTPGYIHILGFNSLFWTSTAFSSEEALTVSFFQSSIEINRVTYTKQWGFSARCIKD